MSELIPRGLVKSKQSKQIPDRIDPVEKLPCAI